MSNLYKAESDVYDMMRDLVGQYHPDLALVVDEIAILFKEKGGMSGGRPTLGKAAKATPVLGVLADTDYKFIITLGQDQWLELTTRQRKALLDHLLCGCRVDDEDGNLKCSVAPPDVSFYWDELDRWGDWRPREDGDGPDGPSVITETFLKKANAADDDDILVQD